MFKLLQLIALLLLAVVVYRLTVMPDAATALGVWTTAWVKPLVVPVVDLINAPPFVYLASAAIFLSAVAVTAWHAQRVLRPTLRSFSACEAELARELPQTTESWSSWTAVDAEVARCLARHNLLVTPWAALSADIDSSGKYPSRPFAAYVAESPLTGQHERSSLMQALPGYYISVGLLLTFLGLVVALYFAARGFRTGDVNEARQAIVQLLNASSFKFLTSVAALAASLLVSIYFRFAQGRVVRAGVRLTQRLEKAVSLAKLSDRKGPGETATLLDIVKRLDLLLSRFESGRS